MASLKVSGILHPSYTCSINIYCARNWDYKGEQNKWPLFEELNSLYGRHILITLPPCEPLITIREKHYEKKDMGTVGKNSILANVY